MKIADAVTHGEETVTMSLPGTRDDVLEYPQECRFSSVPMAKETGEGTEYRGPTSREDLIEHPGKDQLAVLACEVPTANVDDDLETVATVMVLEGVCRILVVDGDAIEDIPIVTDVVRAIARSDTGGETEAGDVAVHDANTTYIDVSFHIVEREIFYANMPYAVVLNDEALLTGVVTEVDITEVTRVIEGETGIDDSVANQDDEWMWEGIKAVDNRYILTRNVEILTELMSRFITDDLASVATRVAAKDTARTMARKGIEQTPLVSDDELIGVVRDINLLGVLYK